MGGGGSSPAPAQQTTVQSTAPWGEQQKFIIQGMRDIGRMAGGVFDESGNIQGNYSPSSSGVFAPLPYSGTSIAAFSPETEAAFRLQTARGLYGSPALESAKAANTATASGAFLGANPYLDTVMQSVQKNVVPATASQFASRGRYGSGAMANATASALAEQAGKLAYQNYGDERTRQMQAAALAPALQAADYRDIAALSEVGASRERMTQAQMDEERAKYYEQQTRPLQAIQNYMNLIKGDYGSTLSSSGANFGGNVKRNPLGAAIGGASALGGLGAALGATGPVGWGLAGLGGILGAFGG